LIKSSLGFDQTDSLGKKIDSKQGQKGRQKADKKPEDGVGLILGHLENEEDNLADSGTHIK
jgi:hypothetical protein